VFSLSDKQRTGAKIRFHDSANTAIITARIADLPYLFPEKHKKAAYIEHRIIAGQTLEDFLGIVRVVMTLNSLFRPRRYENSPLWGIAALIDPLIRHNYSIQHNFRLYLLYIDKN